MKATDQYESIVTTRIEELQRELNATKNLLQKEILTAKINYLKKLTDLPLYMAISTMSLEQLQEVQERYGLPLEDSQAFLIRLFGLEKVQAMVKQPKTVTLEYLKTIMLSDVDFMNTLLELQKKNFEYNSQKQALYGVGLNGTTSYLQLTHDEKNLDRYEAQLESAIEDAEANYDLHTLKEVKAIAQNQNTPLTKEFIEKHSKQVLKKKPEMQKTVKQLTQKGFLGFLGKISPFRKKREQEFLNAVIDYYKGNQSLTTLGITEQNIFEMNETQIRSLLKRVKKQTNQKRNKVNEQRSNIRSSKKVVLETIKQYDTLQSNAKQRFLSLLSTKTNFLPRMFQDQIWNEPDLKESLLRVACYQEEKAMIEALSSQTQATTALLVQVEEKPKQFIKAA